MQRTFKRPYKREHSDMAFRKIIKTGDPDDIRTGFAGAVWDIVKMSSLIGAFVAFFSGMVLKGKLLMLRRAGLRFRWCFWCFSLRSF